MSTAAKQKAKAAGIRLDDDSADTPSEPVVPRTAPGQLIGLQGRVHSQQAEIDKLKRADSRVVSPPQAPKWDS